MNNKEIRKNIYFPNDEYGAMANDFLSKIGHKKGYFVTTLILDFLREKGITTSEQIASLTEKEAQLLIQYKNIGFKGQAQEPQANINSFAQQLLLALTQGVVQAQNNAQEEERLVRQPEPKSTQKVQKKNEKQDDIEDDEDDDTIDSDILASIDSFRN